MTAVLFARSDSIYKTFKDLDVYDIDRDARTFSGSCPVIAHPPCRAWGVLRHMAKPRPDEKELAFFAIDQVRRCGGVLEHPAGSTLWPVAGLPEPGLIDDFGGFTFPVDQHSWGHRARKLTKLYIVGCRPKDLPPIPIDLSEPTHICCGSTSRKPELPKREREETPPAFAAWLVDLANRCH
jgi:hypothetical protein